MAKVSKKNSSTDNHVKIRPALDPENREKQLISLAVDLVEQRLIAGTASAQETTHFLKLASKKAKLEVETMELQKELIAAKTEAIKSEKHREELFVEAIAAMKRYSGNGGKNDED